MGDMDVANAGFSPFALLWSILIRSVFPLSIF